MEVFEKHEEMVGFRYAVNRLGNRTEVAVKELISSQKDLMRAVNKAANRICALLLTLLFVAAAGYLMPYIDGFLDYLGKIVF